MALSPAKIPATIITGFLGAGKTTLIRNLLLALPGRQIALIINEFGDMGFDGALVQACEAPGCEAASVIELANGCICCTVADDFLPAMQTLLARTPPPEHIIIETSGLALPKPLVQAFSWPEVRSRVTVDGVVTVVDAEALAGGQLVGNPAELERQRQADASLDHITPIEELFEDQLACADLVVLAKTDALSEAARAPLLAGLAAKARAGVKIVSSGKDGLAPRVLLGLDAGAEEDLEARPSHHDNEEGEHDHDDFTSFVVTPTAFADRAAVEARVRAALLVPKVLRIKGFARVIGKPAPLVVQRLGMRRAR